MVSTVSSLIKLQECHDKPIPVVGGKTRNLALASQSGYTVPDGFCLTSNAYKDFIKKNRLEQILNLELYRKPFEQMRWEELWDSGLRIRSAFLKSVFPDDLKETIETQIKNYPEDVLFSVRSSATEEDAEGHSFAGIHDSYINVHRSDLTEKIVLVWASLWNDRSLLYRKEKSLDPMESSMAVLVQIMNHQAISGLAFTKNPLTGNKNEMVIETISGTLDHLVDNIKTPETLVLHKADGAVLSSTVSTLQDFFDKQTVLDLYKKIIQLEEIFNYPIDVEWTGLNHNFTLLQVRPITFGKKDKDNDRQWYLSLTPSNQKLIALTNKIENQLLPEMLSDIENLPSLPDGSTEHSFNDLFFSIGESYEKWKRIYWSDFIPFAHGIRKFGQYYNDLLKPDDPFAFIDLLKNEPILAKERNKKMKELALMITETPLIYEAVTDFFNNNLSDFNQLLENIRKTSHDGALFADAFETLLKDHFLLFYEQTSFSEHPEMILSVLLSLSKMNQIEDKKLLSSEENQETTYFQMAGQNNQEAKDWLKIGRLSWKLRDDDNILLAKIEQRLWEFVKEASDKLRHLSLLESDSAVALDQWKTLHQALLKKSIIPKKVTIPETQETSQRILKPRQLLGQPSSSGVASGRARILTDLSDFTKVIPGEILIFDAVQPQMTFIISLAGGIIERRGGMLVHSSIIARELGIPAVNGVSLATELIKNGDYVTVNGDLGIIVVSR